MVQDRKDLGKEQLTDCSEDACREEKAPDIRQAPRRSLFVIPFLIIHTLITAFFLPSFGASPGARIFEVYFIFTSCPTIQIGALLPKELKQSDGLIVCLAINGVLVVWGFACGLHYFLYKAGGERKTS